ncbi:GNAT family N-acetyltransferase [Paramagnetospirillum kuznetsovii]|uniref:GNAT family N-acetyltransferase n=1 Tax=Paramagnetospirillum kuznetsovii TaxID=2053833 RepID=A0A364P1Q8_9PROT|nr:GNAT family N-acetyltransferase [Paramagnetospirillum kuznetsovii]RAU23251.1 GNAT family N-acetyltransferase [Paramagnetospirillum kuznetsovii]
MAGRKKPELFISPDELADENRWNNPQSPWNTAAIKTRQVDPFCCTTSWQMSFHDAFSPNRRLLIRETSDSVVAFAEKAYFNNYTILTPIESMWFFGNPLLGPNSVDLFQDTLVDIEKFYGKKFPNIMISGVAPKGVLYRELRSRFDGKFNFRKHSSEVQCSSSLNGGVDGFVSRRSANTRRNIKKSIGHASALSLVFERHAPSSVDDARNIYLRMLSVEDRSWKGHGRCGMTEPPADQYYWKMIKRLSFTKSARVILAVHEGKDIGFIFGGMAGTIYRGQQFSYDDSWKSASIGTMLQYEKVKWLCEEGATRYDMGPLIGHKMGYKASWTERKHNLEVWILSKH